jgi:hypothetical protein
MKKKIDEKTQNPVKSPRSAASQRRDDVPPAVTSLSYDKT